MDIIIILDRSGSMASIKTEVEGGFATFLEDQREKAKKKTRLTLVQFDSGGIDTVYERKGLADVPKLDFQPRGMTPLLDAVGSTLAKKRERHSEKTLVVIITDGAENDSHEYTKKAVQKAVKAARKAGWEFIYLGANVDAFAEAGQIGIAPVAASPYAPTKKGINAAYRSASAQAVSFSAGGKVGFTDEERDEMGS